MGWYANTEWTLKFRNDQELDQCAGELLTLDVIDNRAMTSSRDIIEMTLRSFNEVGEFYWDYFGLTVGGYGGGKAYDIGPDQKNSYGGKDVYSVLAKYCTGTVDWETEDDKTYWRIRFYGNGTWHSYDGWVAYPDDRVELDEE